MMESNNCAENTGESMEVVDKLSVEHNFEYNVEKLNEEVTKSMGMPPCDKLVETNENIVMEVETNDDLIAENQDVTSNIAENEDTKSENEDLSSKLGDVLNVVSTNNEEERIGTESEGTTTEQEVNTNGDVNMQLIDKSEQTQSDTSPKCNTVDTNAENEEAMEETENPSQENINKIEDITDKSINIQENSNHEDGNDSVSQDVSEPVSNKSDTNGNDELASNEDKPVTESMETQTIETADEEEMEEELEQLEEIDVNICKTVTEQTCFVCKKSKVAKYSFNKKDANVDSEKIDEFVCTDSCFDKLKDHCNKVNTPKYFDKVLCITEDSGANFVRKCMQCHGIIKSTLGCCSWEAMDFCKEHCLYRFQQRNKKQCSECAKQVEYNQLGKYSVRFGCIIRQFCSSTCLDARKKKTRICSYCQLAMSTPGIPLGQKFFCTILCKDKYVQLSSTDKPPYIPSNKATSTFCYICNDKSKPIKIEFSLPGTSYYFCGEECLIIFKFLHNFKETMNKCHNCWKHSTLNRLVAFGMHYDGTFNYFCSKTCQNIHIITHRRIVPCVWCKVKKYNFDMIYKEGLMDQTVFACSLNCLNHLKSALDHVTAKGKYCVQCPDEPAVCDITTADGSTKSFCSNKCIADFQSKLRKLETKADKTGQLPLITSVCSLAETQNEKRILFVVEEEPPEVANKMCLVRPMITDQETEIVKEKCDMDAQTDFKEELTLRAVPVPIYIPQPLNMWNCPLPRAVPFPLVVPLPVLIPLTRDSSTEYLKTMKKEPVKTPRDPYEAELLMMAELVAAEKPKEEIEEPEDVTEDFSPEPVDTGFHDDMLQIALKMATDYQDASAVDLEGSLQANTITPGHHSMELTSADEIIHTEPLTGTRGGGSTRGRGRGRGSRGPRGGTSSRRGRGRPPAMPVVPIPEPSPPPPLEPVEKPDANMCLKYTFGVNAWKQWVTIKNADLERSSRKLKLFKNDLLQMTADELNYSLCLFVNEVRKPNGSEYAPDTIYYLCLGIQQYLYECGRIDNIFCDSFYEKFTDCLDDVCSKFSSLYNDSHYIVTRVEEEHLWESKQLGAHSPYVLLTTLMFFNTKHFNLTSVEEHMQLSFSHIMKHWKRNPGQGGSRQAGAGPGPAGRNVLLRFYPPQNAQANSRKKKVYEQQENEDNPLRCPVKLYEFYLSKCPESVKTRNDVFYLMPERSCVPESPVWYSTMALDVRALKKMLHRVKMVKEINVALLTH